MTGSIVLLAFVTAERLLELWLAQKNTARLLERGAVESASGHYVLIVMFHTLWLCGLWLFGWWKPLEMGWLAAFVALQGLRIWTLATLGGRWTTRIITIPGEELVETGPYRFLKHPNYAVVIGEIAVLPLAVGLPLYSLLFSIANAVLLFIRIRAENRALGRT